MHLNLNHYYDPKAKSLAKRKQSATSRHRRAVKCLRHFQETAFRLIQNSKIHPILFRFFTPVEKMHRKESKKISFRIFESLSTSVKSPFQNCGEKFIRKHSAENRTISRRYFKVLSHFFIRSSLSAQRNIGRFTIRHVCSALSALSHFAA